MSTDDFVFATLIADHPDPATASRALQMAEAAVLRRAADAINALPQDYECDPGWGDAAKRLRATAAGIEKKTGPAPAVVLPEQYPGELDMLRGLVATLHAVADHGDLPDVRKLLAEHRSDDQDARGKSSRTPADATPAGPTGRVGQLLDAIRTARGQWPVHRAMAFYRDNVPALRSMPHRHLRTVARGDLRDLTAWGHLERHDPDGARRFYTLKTRKDGA